MSFDGLCTGFYGAILADPPWSFLTYGGDTTTPHRSEVDPYSVMSLGAIKALPVGNLAAPNCALFLWTISSHMDQSFSVAEAWGFKYKSKAFEWLKTTKSGDGFKMGMGYWCRQESETCLLFTRGKPARLDKGVRSTIWEPVSQHSRKPDETYNRIERLVAGPYCELFATQRREGWDGWGKDFPL